MRSVLDAETAANIHGLLLTLRHASAGAPNARCDQLMKGWDPRLVPSEREERETRAKSEQGRPKSATPSLSSHRSKAHTDQPNTVRAAKTERASGSRPGGKAVAKVVALEQELAEKTRRIEELEQKLMILESTDRNMQRPSVRMDHHVSNYFHNILQETPRRAAINRDIAELRPPSKDQPSPAARTSAII